MRLSIEHVAADLVAPADVVLRVFQLLLLGAALVHLELIEFRAQLLHGAVFVLML